MKAPKPAIVTSFPFFKVLVTMLTKASIMSSACFLLTPTFSEIWLMSSALLTVFIQRENNKNNFVPVS